MKTSIIQFAVMALAIPASSAPSQPNSDLEARGVDLGARAPQFVPALKSERDCRNSTLTDDSTATAVPNLQNFRPSGRKNSTNSGSFNDFAARPSADSKSSNTKSSSGSKSSATKSSSGSKSSATKSSSGSKSSSTKSSSGSKSTAETSTDAASPTTTSSSGSSSGSSGGSLPASSGTSVLSAAQTIAAGASFDGGMVMYDRGVTCTGQAEGGDSDAVFQIEAGGSLSNVIIGPNQIEGVHCQGACTLTNVWWSAVCEDAFTVKNQDAGDTTKIVGGGAFGADDKVVQHNGAGTISISDFTVETFGKLYRSCGNCDTMYERHVIIDGLSATDGKEVAGINSNYGDSATITNSVVSNVDDVCVTYTGTDDNDEEPVENGSGADGTYCIYGSDVQVS